jgi:hypothetical protein
MPINKFTTLQDLARQAKILSGETATFDGKIQVGIPFSGYPTGVDTGTTVSLGIVSSEDAVFSGNSGTTIFDVANTGSTNYSPIFSGYTASTWTNPLFSGNTSGLTLPITPLSADTQIVGPFWTLTQTGMTGDYVIGTQYTGYSVTYSFFNVSQFGTGFTYSGFTTASQENFSAGTLDYKGPLDYISSKEDASVEGRLTTNKITITNGASASTIGYVLTQTGENGEAEWVINASADTNTYVTGGTLTLPSAGSNLILGWNTGGSANPIDLSSLYNVPYWTAGTSGFGSIRVNNGSLTDATGNFAVAQGESTTASGDVSHSEGSGTIASGNFSHAEGLQTIASGTSSHAGGNNSVASGTNSFIHSTNSLVTGDRSVVLGGSGITGTSDDTVYTPDLNVSGDILVENTSGKFLTDIENSAGVNVKISGGTNAQLSRISITDVDDAGIALGHRGNSEPTFPGYGKQGDGFLYSGNEENGLNIISSQGTGTEDYIRFYAGQDANGTTPDLYIQGSGTTRGYVGIYTDSPTNYLDIDNSLSGFKGLRVRRSYTPSSSGDTNGEVGTITWDNNYIYVKTGGGWGRAQLDFAF